MAKVQFKQHNSDQCIVCGKVSPLSLGTDFYALEGDVCLGVTTPRDEHQSYPDRMHGGMITALLDETIGRAVQIAHPELWAVTSKIEVSFKRPVRLNRPIKCFGKVTKTYSLGFVGRGYIEDEDGKVLATATATYVKTPIEKMTDDSFVWELFPADYKVEQAEILHPELLEHIAK